MKLLKLLITISAMVVIVNTVVALPEMLDSFNAKYNTKGTTLDTCDLCHIAGQPQRSSCDEDCHTPDYQPQKIDPVNLNPYGLSLKDHSNIPTDQALIAIENISSAGDKIPNINKIRNLNFPGNRFGQKNNTNRNKDLKDLLSELADMLNNNTAHRKAQEIINLPP